MLVYAITHGCLHSLASFIGPPIAFCECLSVEACILFCKHLSPSSPLATGHHCSQDHQESSFDKCLPACQPRAPTTSSSISGSLLFENTLHTTCQSPKISSQWTVATRSWARNFMQRGQSMIDCSTDNILYQFTITIHLQLIYFLGFFSKLFEETP